MKHQHHATHNLHLASSRRFEDVVVMVHHFGATPRILSRHIRFLNDLGFDVATFQLRFSSPKLLLGLPLTRDRRFGVCRVWEEQITDVLRAIDRPKILMTFSSPSSSALRAITHLPAGQVKGCICEGGPFAQLRKGFANYLDQQMKISSPLVSVALSVLMVELLGGDRIISASKKRLKDLPRNFPVLSIRAWNDEMVSARSIDEYFSNLDHLALEVLSLPEVGHLQGLSKAPVEYKARVEKFLRTLATPTPFSPQ